MAAGLGLITYVHVRAGRQRKAMSAPLTASSGTYDIAGKLARVRVRRATHFAAGDVIATVNPFNHVHLNVGWPGEEVNPLKFRLTHFADTIAPSIAVNGVHLFTEDWQPVPRVKRAPPTVSGRVRIVVDAWDQADGNRPNRRLGLYALGYELLPAVSSAASGASVPDRLVFDRLAIQPEAARTVYDPAAAYLSMGDGAHASSMS